MLVQSVLEMGYQEFKREGVLLPKLTSPDVENNTPNQLARCTQPKVNNNAR